jgi:lipopolysaccharide export system protein LptC
MLTPRQGNLILAVLALVVLAWLASAEPSPPWTVENWR